MASSGGKIMNVEHVVYAKNKECKFTAVAVVPVELKKSDERWNEKCIFSQDLLGDCERIGSIVFSTTKQNEALKWKYLCNSKEEPTGVHLFDLEYLKPYLDFKTAEYLHCPLCKEGIYEEKEHLEEHEIDTMEQLIEKRDAAKQDGDIEMRIFHEQRIFEKACTEKWDRIHNEIRIRNNEKILQETLSHWVKLKKIDELRSMIVDGMTKTIDKDNSNILKIIAQSCGYLTKDLKEERREEWTKLFNYACAKNAFDCAVLLMRNSKLLKIETRPQCLLNAIRSQNVELMDEVLKILTAMEMRFVCDDCFRECIKQDIVGIAKKLIEVQWHKPRDEDYELAETLDGTVWAWLRERKQQTQTFHAVGDSATALDWNEWEGGEDEDFDDETWDDDEN